MHELNPDHPVTRAAHDNWHKILAVLMHKLALTQTEISIDDIQRFAGSEYAAVVLREKNGVMYLSLVNARDAERLAREEGGLPS